MKCVDANKISQIFVQWMRCVLQGASGKTVAIDGKTVCAIGKLTEGGSFLHITSALVSEMNLVIGSIECATKTGEITAFRELLKLLDVSGAVVVDDALHCNQRSANAVIDAGADYLFVVKNNIPALKADIELFIQEEDILSHTTIEKNGGRIEKRTATPLLIYIGLTIEGIGIVRLALVPFIVSSKKMVKKAVNGITTFQVLTLAQRSF